MKTVAGVALALAVACLGGCGTVPADCAPGEHEAKVAHLFFGRNIGDKPGVSEADWEAFVDREISPRFPEGLSVMDTAGVASAPDGGAVHELGKAVVIVLAGKPDDTARLAAVVEAYKARFSQDSVLTAKSRACVAF